MGFTIETVNSNRRKKPTPHLYCHSVLDERFQGNIREALGKMNGESPPPPGQNPIIYKTTSRFQLLVFGGVSFPLGWGTLSGPSRGNACCSGCPWEDNQKTELVCKKMNGRGTKKGIYTVYNIYIYVPGSGSPPTPPAMVMVITHQPPLPPVEWVGPGRGGGHPTSNQQQCNWQGEMK